MKLDQEKNHFRRKSVAGLMIEIRVVLPGKHFTLTSVFSSVFVREVCTSGLHCSVAASPLLLGVWAFFVSFPYPMDGAPGYVE